MLSEQAAHLHGVNFLCHTCKRKVFPHSGHRRSGPARLAGAAAQIDTQSTLLPVADNVQKCSANTLLVFNQDLIPARIIVFNKTAGKNWAVPWHQDRVIAVADRHEVAGFSNWTHKGREWHCEPPRELLDQMYFVRVHLDDNAAADGTMRIALRSHVGGYVPAAEARVAAEQYEQEDCVARRGDVLVLKMLTLHASSSSVTTNPRRVFRVDYAPLALLPKPLEWL